MAVAPRQLLSPEEARFSGFGPPPNHPDFVESLSKLECFESDCSCDDDINGFQAWLCMMPRLQSLRLVCTAGHDEGPLNLDAMPLNIVQLLTAHTSWNTLLTELYHDRVISLIGERLSVVDKRPMNSVILTSITVV